MTDRDLLASIHTLQLRTAEQVGELRSSVRTIEADVASIGEAWRQQGLVLGELQRTCAATRASMAGRLKRQSDEIKRLGGTVEEVKEDTGVIHLEDVRRRAIWWTIAKICGALLALAGLATGAWASIRSCTGVADVRAAVERGSRTEIVVEDHARDEALAWIMSSQRELLRRLPEPAWARLPVGGDVPRPRWRW